MDWWLILRVVHVGAGMAWGGAVIGGFFLPLRSRNGSIGPTGGCGSPIGSTCHSSSSRG